MRELIRRRRYRGAHLTRRAGAYPARPMVDPWAAHGIVLGPREPVRWPL